MYHQQAVNLFHANVPVTKDFSTYEVFSPETNTAHHRESEHTAWTPLQLTIKTFSP